MFGRGFLMIRCTRAGWSIGVVESAVDGGDRGANRFFVDGRWAVLGKLRWSFLLVAKLRQPSFIEDECWSNECVRLGNTKSHRSRE